MTPDKVLSTLRGIAGPDDDQVWVAGSAAICPALAQDIDIWSLAGSKLKPKQFNLDIWEELPVIDDYTDSIPGIISRFQTTMPALLGGEAIKVQVMLTSHKDIWNLLDYFDCSCHVYARNIYNCLSIDPEATLPGSPVKLLGNAEITLMEEGCTCATCTNQRYHLARQAKFTDRYANVTPDQLWLPR